MLAVVNTANGLCLYTVSKELCLKTAETLYICGSCQVAKRDWLANYNSANHNKG
jgi:hypothetical protein